MNEQCNTMNQEKQSETISVVCKTKKRKLSLSPSKSIKTECNKNPVIKTKKVASVKKWVCYLIHSTTTNHTYVGITLDVQRRVLREHGKSSKSAKYTKGKDWKLICFLSGFQTHVQAAQFEKKWHMMSRPSFRKKNNNHTTTHFTNKNFPQFAASWLRRLNQLLWLTQMNQWTKNAPVSSIVPLTIHWCKQCFTNPFTTIYLPAWITTNQTTEQCLIS